MTLAADLDTLLEELYINISEILATEKLTTAARTALGSIKEKIHAYKTAQVARSAPPIPPKEEGSDLPDYGEAEEIPEYEDFAESNPTMPAPLRKTISQASIGAPKSPSPSLADEVTVQTLLSTAVMHGILFRRDRKYMLEQCRKCWAAATTTTFHLFNSEADAKPAASVPINSALEIKVPPDGSKDKKKDLTFEISSGSKRYKLVAPSATERHSWLTVLNNGVPFTTVVYDTTRSLPQTPLDAIETSELIEEDRESLENYEEMASRGNGDEEDIYNSLEDVSTPQTKAAPPPPTVSLAPPALPQTERPSFFTMQKFNVAAAPPSPDNELYDDTGNVVAEPVIVRHPNRMKGAPPPTPARMSSVQKEEIYDEAGDLDDVYDEAGEQVTSKMDIVQKVMPQRNKPPLAIKNQSSLHMEVYDDAGALFDVYDDAGSDPTPAPAKPVPKPPTKMAKAPPPTPPVKNVCSMQIYDDTGSRDEVYDDAGGKDDEDNGMYYDIEEAQTMRSQMKKPDDKPPPLPPLIAAMKSPGSKPPDPPSAKKKPESHLLKFMQTPKPAEPEAEEYDEVGPTQSTVPPPLPPANVVKPQNKPPPPPMSRKPSVAKLIQEDETYDEVAPPTDLASELRNRLSKGSVKQQAPPAPSSKAKPAPQEDIRDASTLTNQLLRLKPVNSLKINKSEKKIEIINNTASPSGNEESSRPVSLFENKFKQADSAAMKKFNQPAPADPSPVTKNFRVHTNGASLTNGNNKPIASSKPTLPTNNKPAMPTGNKPLVAAASNKPTMPASKMTSALKSKFENAPPNNGNIKDDPPAPRGNVRNLAKKIGGQIG